MTFESALTRMKEGKAIRRGCWAHGMHLRLHKNEIGERTIYSLGRWAAKDRSIDASNDKVRHHFEQRDILAEDWSVLR